MQVQQFFCASSGTRLNTFICPVIVRLDFLIAKLFGCVNLTNYPSICR